MTSHNSLAALEKLKSLPWSRCLDIGAGDGWFASQLRAPGREVVELDLNPRDGVIVARYPDHELTKPFDAVWCSHTLEHQPDVGQFLRAIHSDLVEGGWLAVTVPPLKHSIVGGHLTLWNAGLLLYNLVLAGFDCRDAMVKSHDYSVSVIIPHRKIELPMLSFDNGDLERLAEFFPLGLARQGFDGRIEELNWRTS